MRRLTKPARLVAVGPQYPVGDDAVKSGRHTRDDRSVRRVGIGRVLPDDGIGVAARNAEAGNCGQFQSVRPRVADVLGQ